MTAPRLRLPFTALPPGFVRAPKAGERVGLKSRMVRNHAAQERVALMVVQPTGGLEYAIHEAGFAGLPVADNPGDTGDVADGRRLVATFADLAEGLWPCDTGLIDAARRAVANLDIGGT
jgi:hypothetical protein